MTDLKTMLHVTGMGGVTEDQAPWGPTGREVYARTYSRVKPDGSRETWPETVARVTYGNLALVYGDNPAIWPTEVYDEAEEFARNMFEFKVLSAGRHLWATGVKGRQYLFNCHVAGWDSLADHVEFVLMRLAEGGGVGANYSTKHLEPLGSPASPVIAHIVCDPSHPDYEAIKPLLSDEYAADWPGAFEVEDTREGWAAAIIDLINAAYRPDTKHAQRVYDVSRVRWSGARLKTMGGSASGPEPLARALREIGETLFAAHVRVKNLPRNFKRVGLDKHDKPVYEPLSVDYAEHSLSPLEAMSIDHSIAKAIVAGGTRRSARMAIVHWNDPYIWDFISCKANHVDHYTTNISVEIDDDFFDALDHWETIKDAEPVVIPSDMDQRAKHAHFVLKEVTTGMLSNGEPGFWNSSLSNEGEPREVVATNPCGEIALMPWENCNLGHVNLDAFVNFGGDVDTTGLTDAHRLMTRFLIRATYGDVVDHKQRKTLAENRRIGVGHFGVQGFFAKQGYRFSEVPDSMGATAMLETLADSVDAAAVEYARELRIPIPVKTRTVAPTGTIAKMPGRTEGIHPVYARHFVRRVRYSLTDPNQARQVEEFKDKGHVVEPCIYTPNTAVVSFVTEDQLVSEIKKMGLPVDLVESADEISVDRMLAFQEFYQAAWADNAVSFTVNVPADIEQERAMREGYSEIPAPSPERVREVMAILSAMLPTLKGTTMMLDGSRPQAPYERMNEAEFNHAIAHGQAVSTDASYDEECASGACPVK